MRRVALPNRDGVAVNDTPSRPSKPAFDPTSEAPADSSVRPSHAVREALVGPALWLVVGRVLGAAFAAVWLLVAARALQPAVFGRVAVIIGLGTLIGVLAEGGLPLLVVEAVGAEPRLARAVVARTLAVRVPLTVAGALLLIIIAAIVYPSGAPIAALYGVSLVASAVQTTAGSALRASGFVVAEAVSEAGGRMLVLVVGVILIRSAASGTAVAGAYAVGGVLTAGALGWHAARKLPAAADDPMAPAPVARAWKVPFRRAMHLGAAAVLVTAYNRIDLWLLAALASSRSAGLYAAGYRFFEGMILPATAFGALLVPVVARTAPSARPRAIRSYMAAAVGLTTVASGLLLIAAGPVVRVLLGDSFAASVGPLRLLAIAAIPSAAFGVISPLASLAHKRAGINLLLVGSAVNAAVNLALIPVMGATGAAVAQIFSQTLLAVLFWRALTSSSGDGLLSPAPAP